MRNTVTKSKVGGLRGDTWRWLLTSTITCTNVHMCPYLWACTHMCVCVPLPQSCSSLSCFNRLAKIKRREREEGVLSPRMRFLQVLMVTSDPALISRDKWITNLCTCIHKTCTLSHKTQDALKTYICWHFQLNKGEADKQRLPSFSEIYF